VRDGPVKEISMDVTLTDLRRLTLAATDDNLGSVVNLCFDDRNWTIRYLVVDASSWFPDHWVLISPVAVSPLGPGSEHPPRRAQQDAGRSPEGPSSLRAGET
jgi:hypothetical protein